MDRLYTKYVDEFLHEYKKMVFISGARQVGKTTLAKMLIDIESQDKYFNWDYVNDRDIILNEHHELFSNMVAVKTGKKPRLILDEIHKFPDWKNLIKGFYDKFGDHIEFIITGSAKLDIYKKGGDSLMGRYINLTVHPLSMSELSQDFKGIGKNIISLPKKLDKDIFDNLLKFGGFAEPYLKSNERFYNLWSRQRFEQLFKEDIRNVEDISNMYGLELLATTLINQSGQLTNYTNLAKKVRVSDQTIRRWTELLQKYYYCFCIRPWSNNVARSLLKDPKYYLWDWSQINNNDGAKFENFLASHLFKSVIFWNEIGLGSFSLHYLRDKQKREVDFLVAKNNKPWFLVEVKSNDIKLSNSLRYFHECLKPEYSFQVVKNLPDTQNDCFEKSGIWVVPAITFLTQLV
ncbi:MAG: ATP-binding protein [Rickettsiaceae bacterium]|nr:ATP-binding protein [Rickettsiaceae bacterium]